MANAIPNGSTVASPIGCAHASPDTNAKHAPKPSANAPSHDGTDAAADGRTHTVAHDHANCRSDASADDCAVWLGADPFSY